MNPDRAEPLHTVHGQFGPYTIVSELGAGGMGIVYQARDEKLGRHIALKVLPSELSHDLERRARLLREAQAVASLNHPNICTVHEVGEADGHAYIAMELVEGKPLSARLAEGPLPMTDVMRYGLQLAEALAHAHDRGIVHRDLKSANVMVTPEGRIKVLDFGLAKRAGGAEVSQVTTGAAASLTQPGMIVGTLPYMAPEQLRGQVADTRSDVWALGVMLYEMAAGARPFTGPTAFELSAAILHEPAPPLSGGRVAGPLQAVIGRCLEKEPARRYQRGAELQAALETLGDHATRRAAGWFEATPRAAWPVAAVSLVVVLAVAAAVIWWKGSLAGRQAVSGGSAGEIRSLAVLPLENLVHDPTQDYFVAGIHEALITDLAQIGLQKVIAKASADAFKDTKKSLRAIGQELGVEGLVTGSVMLADSRVRVTAQLVRADNGAVLWANKYERNKGDVLSLQSELVAAIAREVQATVSPEQQARLASAPQIDPAAQDAYLKGRSLFASFTSTPDTKYLDASIAQYEQAIRIEPTYAPSYAALSLSYVTASQGSWRPPKETFAKARAAALKAVELDDRLAAAHAILASVFLWFDWNWSGAQSEVRRALQLNPDSLDALTASLNYVTLVSGQADEAARTLQRIVDVDPLNPFSRVQTVWTAFFSRRYDEAIARATTLVELQPNNIMGPWFLAGAYAVKGMRSDVVAQCDRVMKLLGGAFVMQPIAECVANLARVGRTADARRLLERLEHPPSGIWLDPVPMGDAYAGVHDVTRAVDWYERGLEDRSPNMVYLKTDAAADLIRDDSRFLALLAQMNFPQ